MPRPESPEPDPHAPPEEPSNPTSEELDVEGPNESAPGHEPEGEDGEETAGSPSRPGD